MVGMSVKHPLDRAAFAVDGVGKLAGILRVSSSAICNWKKRGVPIDRCVAIERATGGQVGRKDLRPDDWAEHWPELQQDANAPRAPAAASEERRQDQATAAIYANTLADRRAPVREP
jgi:DNA-binding transcriptional regulator YdaS (Cro superfamily)